MEAFLYGYVEYITTKENLGGNTKLQWIVDLIVYVTEE